MFISLVTIIEILIILGIGALVFVFAYLYGRKLNFDSNEYLLSIKNRIVISLLNGFVIFFLFLIVVFIFDIFDPDTDLELKSLLLAQCILFPFYITAVYGTFINTTIVSRFTRWLQSFQRWTRR